jgi:purine nucleosidase
MARKVIIDCDMGIDDAVALSMVLFDSRFEILAVTATAGCVTAEQANHNLQAIIAELDPARYPRLGTASPADDAPPVDTQYLFGADGLGNSDFEVSQLQHGHTSEKLIGDILRANPGAVSIVCLGPPTNVAKAFRRDPTLVPLADRIILTGGSMIAKGNVTPAAEFNFYFDPLSAREVIQSKAATILLPLEITQQVTFGFGMMDDLPSDSTRTGDFLRQILPFAFRAYRQQLGQEGIPLNAAIGALALLEPQLFQFETMAADVETQGELTRGALVLDQRQQPEWRPNVDVAVSLREEVAYQFVIDQLVMSSNQETP